MRRKVGFGAVAYWGLNAAILFFVIGCVLAWQAVARHDWVYGAFAGITFLNALMTTLKLISLRETKQ